MKKRSKIFKNPQDKIRFVLFWIIRILLALLILTEIQSERWSILFLNVFAFCLTFLPSAIRRIFSISLPLALELLFLLSLLSSVFLEKLLTGVAVQIILGMLLGIIGFILMFVLYSNARIKTSYSLIALFSFCFSVSLGAVWEVFVYLLIVLLNIRLGKFSVSYSLQGLMLMMIGAIIVSVFGYLYIKYGKGELLNRLTTSFIVKNPMLFKGHENSPEFVYDLIKNGESETLEFKSTLRINLHTKQVDKKMEYEVIKAVVAFLNTDGGTLLVGVSNKGEIIGVEKDGFKNNDIYHRHFTNLVKEYIGNEYLPFIKSVLVPIDNVNVLKIDCVPSNKEVFLKTDGVEEFYVRTGPTSRKLEGSKLVEYVDHRFKRG